MDKQSKYQLISWSGVIMTMLGILVVFYYMNVVSTLFLWGILDRDTSSFLFKAQVIIKMLAILSITVGIIFIFHKSDS